MMPNASGVACCKLNRVRAGGYSINSCFTASSAIGLFNAADVGVRKLPNFDCEVAHPDNTIRNNAMKAILHIVISPW
jgi:hypothetical protein